ncbi:unnamed protein product [Diplocarpon coronariae]
MRIATYPAPGAPPPTVSFAIHRCGARSQITTYPCSRRPLCFYPRHAAIRRRRRGGCAAEQTGHERRLLYLGRRCSLEQPVFDAEGRGGRRGEAADASRAARVGRVAAGPGNDRLTGSSRPGLHRALGPGEAEHRRIEFAMVVSKTRFCVGYAWSPGPAPGFSSTRARSWSEVPRGNHGMWPPCPSGGAPSPGADDVGNTMQYILPLVPDPDRLHMKGDLEDIVHRALRTCRGPTLASAEAATKQVPAFLARLPQPRDEGHDVQGELASRAGEKSGLTVPAPPAGMQDSLQAQTTPHVRSTQGTAERVGRVQPTFPAALASGRRRSTLRHGSSRIHDILLCAGEGPPPFPTEKARGQAGSLPSQPTSAMGFVPSPVEHVFADPFPDSWAFQGRSLPNVRRHLVAGVGSGADTSHRARDQPPALFGLGRRGNGGYPRRPAERSGPRVEHSTPNFQKHAPFPADLHPASADAHILLANNQKYSRLSAWDLESESGGSGTRAGLPGEARIPPAERSERSEPTALKMDIRPPLAVELPALVLTIARAKYIGSWGVICGAGGPTVLEYLVKRAESHHATPAQNGRARASRPEGKHDRRIREPAHHSRTDETSRAWSRARARGTWHGSPAMQRASSGETPTALLYCASKGHRRPDRFAKS